MTKGICQVCGCDHEHPCEEGCAWANVKQTLCTACAPLPERERERKRAAALDALDMEWEAARSELAAVQARIDVLKSAVPLLPRKRKAVAR